MRLVKNSSFCFIGLIMCSLMKYQMTLSLLTVSLESNSQVVKVTSAYHLPPTYRLPANDNQQPNQAGGVHPDDDPSGRLVRAGRLAHG
jgi:hypothetical protein